MQAAGMTALQEQSAAAI
jgi:hypothetical protein